MLGRDLCTAVPAAGHELTAATSALLDIIDAGAFREAVAGYRGVVNASVWTAVESAEARETEALAVNADWPTNLARACAAAATRLVQVSTDYAFSGCATSQHAHAHPRGTKSGFARPEGAEEAVRALCPDFARTIAPRAATLADCVQVVDDQGRQRTWTVDLGELITGLVEVGAPAEIYHGTSPDETTWWALAYALQITGHDPERMTPTTGDDLGRPVPCPAYSVIGHAACSRLRPEVCRQWHHLLEANLDRVAGSVHA